MVTLVGVPVSGVYFGECNGQPNYWSDRRSQRYILLWYSYSICRTLTGQGPMQQYSVWSVSVSEYHSFIPSKSLIAYQVFLQIQINYGEGRGERSQMLFRRTGRS